MVFREFLQAIHRRSSQVHAVPTTKEGDLFYEKLLHLGGNIRGLALPREAGISFFSVEYDKEKGSRIGLSYLLKRIS